MVCTGRGDHIAVQVHEEVPADATRAAERGID
jgi:hypothetical protein